MHPGTPPNDAPWKDAEPGEAEFLPTSRPSSPCPHPDLIFSARSGVSGQGEEQVLEHVAHCAVCATLLRGLEEPEAAALRPDEQVRIRNLVYATVEKRPAPAPRRFRYWFAIPALAAAAAIVVLLMPARRDAIAPSPAVAGQTQKPAEEPVTLALTKPPIRLPASVLVFRGNDDPAAAYAQSLAEALAPYRSNDYAAAARLLEPLSRKYPKNFEAPFYLGVTLVFLNRAKEAVPWLESAKQLSAADPSGDAAWYLAIAHQRAGDRLRAATELQLLCGNPGPHQAEACSATK